MTIPNQNPLGYTGLKETNPPNVRNFRRDPTPQDYIGFDIGDFWINISTTVSWQLLSKAGGVSVWAPSAGGVAQVQQLTGDGGVALPVGGNIDILGGNGITTAGAGNAISVDNSSFFTQDDANLALFTAGNVNVLGGNGISTSTTIPSTINIALDAPVSIANGGTNTNAMATNTGIVKYDGTKLITSTTALIDANNVYTNTSQPCFFAYNNTQRNNFCGDGNFYIIPFNTEVFDQSSSYDNTTYTFTAPVTGKYFFHFSILITPMVVTQVSGIALITTPKNYNFSNYGKSFSPMPIAMSVVTNLSATNTVTAQVNCGGSTKNDGIYGSNSSSDCKTYFCGYLIG